MKKIACILLSAAILSSMSAHASAKDVSAESGMDPASMQLAEAKTSVEKAPDQRLAEVASKVKAALDIGDEYKEFTGNLMENELVPQWSLEWSTESETLSVEAFENGQVTSYYFYEKDAAYPTHAFSPSFPAITRTQSQKIAQEFLNKVLDDGETIEFSERSVGQLNTETHRFSGDILINGLESPLSFSISVRAKDGKVVRFYRDCLEGSYIGDTPSPTPNTGSNNAGELLKDTLSLRTEYVLEDGKAVLRFLPEDIDDFYVDAQTGKLVNLTDLYSKVNSGETGASNSDTSFDASAPEASADKGAGGLTPVELEGVSKLEGVLSKEDLDKNIRSIPQLGLDKYTLAGTNYSLNKETDEVSARLSYTRRDGDNSWRRTITCNAKTGGLQSVWSSFPYNKDRTASISKDKARETVEAFLGEYWGTDYAKTELYDSTPWESESRNAAHAFIYAQKENGFFLPENSFNVSVDIEDGSISGFSRNWTDVTEFESPDGILSDSAALDAWFNHYNLRMGYSRIPVKLDPNMSDAVPLLERGYSYFYSLDLTYTLAEPDNVFATGVNAKTGEIVIEGRYGESESIVYSDLNGYAGREKLEALAEYGIGWRGEKCEPNEELTQVDYIALLASADGYLYNAEEDDVDDLYRRAYNLGILKSNDRDDDRVLSRGDVVKMLLDCAGYGEVAQLSGIFSCAYPDAAQIPANLTGYAAIAQGMGIIGVEQEFAAGKSATRGEATEMLYNFMDR